MFHAVNRADNGRPKKAKRDETCRDLVVIKTRRMQNIVRLGIPASSSTFWPGHATVRFEGGDAVVVQLKGSQPKRLKPGRTATRMLDQWLLGSANACFRHPVQPSIMMDMRGRRRDIPLNT